MSSDRSVLTPDTKIGVSIKTCFIQHISQYNHKSRITDPGHKCSSAIIFHKQTNNCFTLNILIISLSNNMECIFCKKNHGIVNRNYHLLCGIQMHLSRLALMTPNKVCFESYTKYTEKSMEPSLAIATAFQFHYVPPI